MSPAVISAGSGRIGGWFCTCAFHRHDVPQLRKIKANAIKVARAKEECLTATSRCLSLMGLHVLFNFSAIQ